MTNQSNSTQDTEDVVARLIAMVVQSARERESASRLPDCIEGAQQRLDKAVQSLSDRIDVLEAENARLRANDVGCPVCNDRNSSMADPAENFCDKHYRLYLATWQVHPKDLDDYRAKRRAALHQEGIAPK